MAQPVARVDVAYDTYFGTTIADPYRWMEDWKSDEAMGWLTAQGEHTREALDALPDRAALLARINELSDAESRLYDVQIAGERVFYQRLDPGSEQFKLLLRPAIDGPERVLIDPNTMPGEAATAIDWCYPSPDGSRVAYGLSHGGSENSTLYVIDTDTGVIHDLAISRVRWGRSAAGRGVDWVDNHTFVYSRLPEPSADVPESERYHNSRIYLHRLGRNPDDDPAIFGVGVHPDLSFEPIDIPKVWLSASSPWMIGLIQHGVKSELTLYTAPRSALSEPAAIPWRPVVSVADEVASFVWAGDTIYLRTAKNAPRYQVIAMPLAQPDSTHAAVVVPMSRAVIESIHVAGDYLLTIDLDGGAMNMRRVARGGGEVEAVALPFEGSIWNVAANPERRGALLEASSWALSRRVYRYDTVSGAVQDTGLQPPSRIDMSGIESYEVFAPSKDGTLIPLSIIQRKGLKRDGTNPTLLIGYGSYGVSFSPFYWPTLLAWYERGGIFAVAHLRGGGEYGKEWHLAGKGLNKQNTIDDFIACAEYLIREGYTRPGRLAGEGGSAGGIPTGGALVQRPDLWAAMVILVGVTNALRMEFLPNGAINVPELGSVATEEGFKALQLIDAYSKVQDGVPYPAVLLTTGLNDPRVMPSHAMKMAARLQRATTSERPVLLRVEMEGGHGLGSTKSQVNEELADEFAFLLDQFDAA